jgi:ribA/ribD-fused uncharacterized protein
VYFLGGMLSQWPSSAFYGRLPYLNANRKEGESILAPFDVELKFNCAEQYMMASKAMMFEDHEALVNICSSTDPATQKRLGRSVKRFDPGIWNAHARHIVTIGNFYKFTQCEQARIFLESIGDRYLVEGAHYDPVWGVGLAWNDDAILDSNNWKGTNWLGESIMAVRDARVNHAADADPWKIIFKWQTP